MTNPNDAVGTNAAYNGRTSVNAFNDSLSAFSRGILSGWACTPKSGMTVTIGGSTAIRDVAVAEDNVGNKTTIDNIGGEPIEVTIPTAPTSNSRIDLIVAYVDNLPQGQATSIDNPGACGLIVVSGTAVTSPTAPNDSAIRTAITNDGANGTNAYYTIIAQVSVSQNITTITGSNITAGVRAYLSADTIASSSITAAKLASNAVTSAKIASNAVTTAKINNGAVTSDKIDWANMPEALDPNVVFPPAAGYTYDTTSYVYKVGCIINGQLIVRKSGDANWTSTDSVISSTIPTQYRPRKSLNSVSAFANSINGPTQCMGYGFISGTGNLYISIRANESNQFPVAKFNFTYVV